LESNWRWNVEEFGLTGWQLYKQSPIPTEIPVRADMAAELSTPFLWDGRLVTHIARIFYDPAFQIFNYGFLLEDTFFPWTLGNQFTFTRWPYGIGVLPD